MSICAIWMQRAFSHHFPAFTLWGPLPLHFKPLSYPQIEILYFMGNHLPSHGQWNSQFGIFVSKGGGGFRVM
jgi:hypothetical protein